MALPITLDEIRPQLKAMFLPLNNDMEVKYTLVHINNQFKIVGTFTSSAHISTFTLDLQQNIPRQFIYEDLHNIIKYMKHSFQDFLATSQKYTTPFLGGLSLHLNHLIASRKANYDWPFGTLPFGLFGSNLDTRDLETYPMTYSGHF